MCIGIPGQICQLLSAREGEVDINGVRRRVDLSLVGSHDDQGQPRLGQWVIVHVGFAMSLIDEQEAKEMLTTLNAMLELEPDVGAL
ncbi:MAG: HypC/HybG/HupF family hydrogenase formation chaperone, partial [Enterobacteriaceae bacterium]